VKNRINWSKQLSGIEVKAYTKEHIFSNCNPLVADELNWFLQSGTKAFNWPGKKTDQFSFVAKRAGGRQHRKYKSNLLYTYLKFCKNKATLK